MITYVRFHLNSEGDDMIEVLGKCAEVNWHPVVGKYDVSKESTTPEEFEEHLKQLHEALRGSNVHYTLTTVGDDDDEEDCAIDGDD